MTADYVDRIVVEEGGVCLRYQADQFGEWLVLHEAGDQYELAIFRLSADFRQFLVACLAWLDQRGEAA